MLFTRCRPPRLRHTLLRGSVVVLLLPPLQQAHQPNFAYTDIMTERNKKPAPNCFFVSPVVAADFPVLSSHKHIHHMMTLLLSRLLIMIM